MSKLATKVLRQIVERFESMETLARTAFRYCERVPDRRARLRVMEVATFVAEQRGCDNSPIFRADLTEALAAMGVRRFRNGGVAYYRGVARKR